MKRPFYERDSEMSFLPVQVTILENEMLNCPYATLRPQNITDDWIFNSMLAILAKARVIGDLSFQK